MDVDVLKREVGRSALAFVEPSAYLGVGTGSTAEHFIRALCEEEIPVAGAVPSSERTRALLVECGIPVVDLPSVGRLPLYVDGADQADAELRLIKGGGGALTREKIVAASSELFVCIADETKLVGDLGAFPVPVEVIAMARELVRSAIAELGGDARHRQGFVTDGGNIILDVAGLDLTDPEAVEATLDSIPGVVECGLFARRRADVLLLGTTAGVRRLGPR